jgi:hypothetical protein
VYNLCIDRQRIYFALEVKRIEPGVNKIKGVVKAEGRVGSISVHCDFYIYYSFPYSDIRTRVISGFGGTQNDIGSLDGF